MKLWVFWTFLRSWRVIPGGKKYPPDHFAPFPTLKTIKNRLKNRFLIEIRVDFLKNLKLKCLRALPRLILE